MQPHDRLFRSSMSDLRVAKDFFKHYLPSQILDSINLDTLTLNKESFIDKELQLSIIDMLYSVNFESKNNSKGFIYILAEHQHTAQKQMPFRLLKYVIKIMEYHCQQNQSNELPIVYPLVFYNGSKKYPYSTSIFELFGEQKEFAKEILFKPFQLIDIGQISDEIIKAHRWSGLMEYFGKHIVARDILPYI